MTEAEQRRQESPLLSDRGVTTIKDTVVSKIAGMAAGEVEGVHMGGGASRSAGGLLEGITGSESTTRGVSVEVGSVEAAIDLKMGIDYGKSILGTVGEVRQKITERVHSITGLNVTELNVTISDVVFPQDGQDGAEGTEGTRQRSDASTTRAVPTRTVPRQELRPGASEREVTPVEPRSRTYTEGASGPVPDEEVRAEGTPVEEDETRRLRFGHEETSGTGAGSDRDEGAGTSASGTSASGTSASGTSASGTSGGSHAEAPTDETTLTGGTSSGERAARETASNEGAAGETEEIDRDRVSEAEERRARRRRRREERGEDGEG